MPFSIGKDDCALKSNRDGFCVYIIKNLFYIVNLRNNTIIIYFFIMTINLAQF